MIATCFNGDQLGVRSTRGVTKFAAATASHLCAIVSVVTQYQKIPVTTGQNSDVSDRFHT
jgi:hypothetical protein